MNLDPEQQAAAHAEEDHVLVSSAPGSGKTRTVVARYRYMRDELGIPASRIVLLTFTRYAANEMRERIGECGDTFIGTFHAFCLRIIREYGTKLGWDYDWLTILDEEETRLEEKQALIDMGLRNNLGKWHRCKASQWEKFKRKGELPEDPHLENLMIAVGKLMLTQFAAENVLTFDTMVKITTELLEDAGILQGIRNRYRHFIVDECQDSDLQQWNLVTDMDPESTFFVGDIDQCIYSWRGARPDLFIDAADRLALYRLPNSYRFGINIGGPANQLIAHNTERLPSAINAIASNEGCLNVSHNVDYPDLAGSIADELKMGIPPDEIAVLARRHASLDDCAKELEAAGVDHFRVGGATSIEKTSEFRTYMGYLRLAMNPHDKRAFMAVAPFEGISAEDLLDLRQEALAGNNGISHYYGKDLPMTLDAVCDYVAAANMDKLEIEGQMRWEKVLYHLKELMFREGLQTSDELVRHVALQSDQDKMSAGEGKIKLCTVHAAKGLEWDSVFFIGMNAPWFPSKRAIKEGMGEEERRLMYVAMTRAKENLYLVHNADPFLKDLRPTPYLEEAGV